MNHYQAANCETAWIKWAPLVVILSVSSQVVAQEDAPGPGTTPADADDNTNRAEGETEGTAEAEADERGAAEADDGKAGPEISDNSEERPEPPGGPAEFGDMEDPTVEQSAGMGSDVAYGDRGVVELGGTFGFDLRDELFTLRIAPTVGYFLVDRFELTLVPIISVVNVSDNAGPSETTVAFSVVLEPSYHLPLSDWFYVFAGLGMGVTFEEGPGADFLLRPVVGVDIMIGRSGILKPYGFLDVGLGNGAVGGGFMAGYTVMF